MQEFFHRGPGRFLAGMCVIFSLSPAPSFSTELIDPNWWVADIGNGVKPSFDFDADGRIHVMGMFEVFGGDVWYSSAETMFGPWSPTTVSNGYFYGPGDLRVDPSGTVHIAWHDHEPGNPAAATVMPGGQISTILIGSPGHNGWDNTLAISSSGTVHMSTINPSNFGATDGLEFRSFDGTTWTHESTIPGSGPVMYGFNTGLAMDTAGNPHMAYCGSIDWVDPGDLKYATRTGGVWQVSSVVTGGIRGRFPSLALDALDRPHIAWMDIDAVDHSLATVRYGVLTAGVWDIEVIDTLTDVKLGFPDARKSVSLVLDSQWRPHVAYSDQKVIRYACKPSGAWGFQTVIQHSQPTYRGLVVLRLDPDERAGIIFWQGPGGDTGQIRLARPVESLLQFSGIVPTVTHDGVVLEWSTCLDGHEYTVQSRTAPSASWVNEPGSWPISATTWSALSGADPWKEYRVLATPF